MSWKSAWYFFCCLEGIFFMLGLLTADRAIILICLGIAGMIYNDKR